MATMKQKIASEKAVKNEEIVAEAAKSNKTHSLKKAMDVVQVEVAPENSTAAKRIKIQSEPVVPKTNVFEAAVKTLKAKKKK